MEFDDTTMKSHLYIVVHLFINYILGWYYVIRSLYQGQVLVSDLAPGYYPSSGFSDISCHFKCVKCGLRNVYNGDKLSHLQPASARLNQKPTCKKSTILALMPFKKRRLTQLKC